MSTVDRRERFYRDHGDTPRWKTFCVKKDASDLYIRAHDDLTRSAAAALNTARKELEDYISEQSEFLHSLEPVAVPEDAPLIVRQMARAGALAGTGPMAAVAGAVAETVGRVLLSESDEVLIENGGDTWLSITEPVRLNVFPGNVYFEQGIAIQIVPGQTPCSVCTSSGKMGHSLSLGKADGVTVIADTGALADAAATAAANLVQNTEDIPEALEHAAAIKGVTGVLIIHRDQIGALGNIELCRI